ncbi:MAG: sugar ABC transporter permease [Demequinaceae bacterium]|nr:sugar ABC transporter permease [Demequinaceae bacterium]
MSAKSVTAKAAATTDAGDDAKAVQSTLWARFDHVVVPYILVSPFFLLFFVFGIFPIVYSGLIAFKTFRNENPAHRDGSSINVITRDRWIGFENFDNVLHDDFFWQALLNTFGIFLLSTIPQLFLALLLASLLNRKLRATLFYRVGILLPYVTPIVASSIVFVTFFSRDYGQANWLLSLFGVESTYGADQRIIDGLDWQSSWWTSWLAISIMVNWKWTAYNALLYLSAMQSIPKDVYEAAALDGASPWRQLWSITVPMIRPMVIFTVVLSTIGGLQLFAEPVQFDTNPATGNGGNQHQWRTVSQLIWKYGWIDDRFGHSGAMSWVLFIIVVMFAALNAFLTSKLGGGKR